MTRVVPETVVVKLLNARLLTLCCMLSTKIVWAGLVLVTVLTPFDKLTPMPLPAVTVSPLAPNPLMVSCEPLMLEVAPAPKMISSTVPAA